MARLGTWEPMTVEERLDRVESLAEIEQLPRRYALALDSRDLDALVALFVPDVRVGREARGRPALKAWFAHTMSAMRTTIHLTGNHVIDFDDAAHAHGVVYCRDQLDRPDGTWEIGDLQYWDTYARVDGDWCFVRRRFHRWYICDALARPRHGAGVDDGASALSTAQLPEAFESWHRFWAEVESDDG